MVDTTRRIREKGQRTPRNKRSYQAMAGRPGAVRCRCGAVLRNKSWHWEPTEESGAEQATVVCPACQRSADVAPAGIVTLSGNFLNEHLDEINQLLTPLTDHESFKNPLSRVMEIKREDDRITITTTNTKLAQKIGRVFFSTYGGDLHYNWAHGEDLVRVAWARNIKQHN